MTGGGRLVRFGVWLAAAGGWLAGQATGQSVWLTGQIQAGYSVAFAAPPALVFDNQDRPEVVCDTGASTLQYAAGDAAGVIPNWSAWLDTGVSRTVPPGQIYLARSGSLLYLGFRPRSWSSSPSVRAAVFDGTAWQNWSLNVNPANPYGLAIDAAGQPQWVINNETPRYASDGTPTWGYYVGTTYPGPGGSTVVSALALGTGGGMAGTDLLVRYTLGQGGQAILDRFGTLHTIQYYPRGSGTLLYAKGPLTGPFQVHDNLEPGWQVKLGRPSVAVDASGAAHVVYTQQWPGYGLRHLTLTGGSWAGEWIEQGGSAFGYVGTFPQILVDRVDVLRVIYADPLHGVLKHAAKIQGQWQIETVDQIGFASANTVAAGMPAAAMDSLGGIGVVYWDAANLVLKYAYRLPTDQTATPAMSRRMPAEEVTDQ